jgi:putative thioredoxin
MGTYSLDVDGDSFQQVVIEGSREIPVVVDFWASWCGPCRALKPILEKLAEEFQGKFILAKVDADQNQATAAQYGVRGIPSVKAFVNGELADEFSGALPESEVRAFLDRLIPSPAEALCKDAALAREEGDTVRALQLLAQASKLDPKNEIVRLEAADILLEGGQREEAKHLFSSLSDATRAGERGKRLEAKLSFAQSGNADESELRKRLALSPDDLDAQMQLANLLIAAGRHQDGLEELLALVRRDRAWNDGAARKAMLVVFDLLGGQGPLVSEYRRKLSSALN